MDKFILLNDLVVGLKLKPYSKFVNHIISYIIIQKTYSFKGMNFCFFNKNY
jgi:hypothetical protein